MEDIVGDGASRFNMPTPTTDNQLFVYAMRAMGKVVVITGTSPSLVYYTGRTLPLPRRGQ